METKAVVLFLLSILALQLTQELDNTYELIDVVNNKKTSWSARANFPNSTTDDLKKMIRQKLGFFTKDETGTIYHKLKYYENIPKFFDAREQWPECESIISYVRDQGSCASSWAITPAAVMSDRLCIESKGKELIHISDEDLITCCKSCSDFENTCDGGMHHKVWEYWRDYGIVSGGGHDSMTGCKPTSSSTFLNGTSPHCEKRCTNQYFNATANYTQEKYFGEIIYKVPKREKQIQIEIMTQGPVAAVMAVFEDFFFYEHGLYTHRKENRMVCLYFRCVQTRDWKICWYPRRQDSRVGGRGKRQILVGR
jgi:cathepsin B